MRKWVLWLALAAAAGLGACRASMNAELHTEGEGGDGENFDDPMETEGASTAKAAFEEEVPGGHALLGARHDLALNGDSPQAVCSCLAATVGYPSNPAFFWHSVMPTLNPGTQLVIAFTSEGVSCATHPEGTLGASYWGYRMVNDDVVVIVENGKFGRPATNGAIIPAPRGGGSVYVEPLDGKVPYGRPLDGSGKRCEVPVSAAQAQVVPPPPHTAPEEPAQP